MREQAEKDAPCPPGWCDTVPGRVLIKLKAPELAYRLTAEAGPVERAQAREDERTAALAGLRAFGITDLEPLFPNASRPAASARMANPDGDSAPVPDLTRWYAATTDATASIPALAERLAARPDVLAAEPDYYRERLIDDITPRRSEHLGRRSIGGRRPDGVA